MKNKKTLLLIVLLAVIAVTIYILVSKEILVVRPGPASVKMDELTLHTSEFPKSFNAYVNNSVDASQVFDLVYATLMEVADKTLEFQPLIAESWSLSPDQKEITVKLNPAAEWSDGTPITAEDVKFTYDVIAEPGGTSPR